MFSENISDNSTSGECDTWKTFVNRLKMIFFVFIWILCCCALMVNNKKIEENHQLSVPKDCIKDYYINEKLQDNQIWLMVKGALLPGYYENLSSYSMIIWIQHLITDQVPPGHANVHFISHIQQVKVYKNI